MEQKPVHTAHGGPGARLNCGVEEAGYVGRRRRYRSLTVGSRHRLGMHATDQRRLGWKRGRGDG